MTIVAPDPSTTADPLSGRVVVVTGASSGIGAALMALLTAAGAHVVAVDRVRPGVGNGDEMCLDLSDPAATATVIAEAVGRHGRLDHVVNNAGLARHAPVTDIDLAEVDLMWQVNVRAVIQLTKDALRAMTPPAGRGGRIVNVISTAGLAGQPGESVYCATKFAVRGFTEAAAEEGRALGVRVTGVYPAGVHTPFWRNAVTDPDGFVGDKQWLDPVDVAGQIASVLRLPLHVDVPSIVVRHPGDADVAGITAKLDQVRRP